MERGSPDRNPPGATADELYDGFCTFVGFDPTILFAADFSENSVHAFRVACALAVEDKTRLIVLHVAGPDETAAEHASSRAEDRHRSLQHRMREVYSPNRPIDVHYRIGAGEDPAAEIIRVAKEIEADLIAMGTHGRTGLRRPLAGSVASTVLARAHCSALALRAGHREPKAGVIQVILHPTDFSKASEAALRVARALARDHGARLVVLHVVPIEIYLEGRMVAEIDTREYQDSLNAIRVRLDGTDLKYPVETRLVRGFEAEEILREAQDFGSDLIVMGTHGRTGLGRLLLGNTAESLLPKADCPVLVVKSPPDVAAPEAESVGDLAGGGLLL